MSLIEKKNVMMFKKLEHKPIELLQIDHALKEYVIS